MLLVFPAVLADLKPLAVALICAYVVLGGTREVDLCWTGVPYILELLETKFASAINYLSFQANLHRRLTEITRPPHIQSTIPMPSVVPAAIFSVSTSVQLVFTS